MSVSSSVIFFCYFSTLVAAQWSNLQCNQVSRSKRTVLESPKVLPASCDYTIEAYSAHTCQILIQFERFILQQPTVRNGVVECLDRLTIDDFTICGDNAQQHLYIPVQTIASSGTRSRVSLKFDLSSRWSQSQWRIHVTQLECPYVVDMLRLSNVPGLGFLQNFENATRSLFPPPYFGDMDQLAPTGCDQYYTQPSGMIKTFNFDHSNGSVYVPNMTYVICIKGMDNGIKNIDLNFEKFSMSVQNTSQAGYDVDCHSTIETTGRRKDYLMIPRATLPNLSILRPTHFCGQSLEGHRVIASMPFIMYFQSDDLADPTETGFIINYNIK